MRFEKVKFANMCMICDKNKVIVMDSKKRLVRESMQICCAVLDGDQYADDILMAILEDDWKKQKEAEG